MDNKLLYWVPVIGFLICIAKYEQENDLTLFWSYYQAAMVIAFISIVSILTYN